MPLLTVDSITKHFGPDPVLDGVTFDVQPGEHIGLVGPNGSGKTTLLKIIAGFLETDKGMAGLHGSSKVGYLQQHVQFERGQTVWDVGSAALADLVALAAEAESVAKSIANSTDTNTRRKLEQRFDFLQHELQRRDGYQLNHKIERVLEGLGFDRDSFQKPVNQLSGGQMNRLLLAQLLISGPDIMLLDEPSNHLDIETTQWLEGVLADSSQAFIVVSHDRYFLDKVTSRTLELFRGTIDSYVGNFSAYWSQKAERLEFQQRAFQRQQEEIEKLKEFVRRHHYGQKHAQAEDRRKKIERIELVEAPREIKAPPMAFPKATRCGDIVLRAEGISKRYDQPLFQDLEFQITRGQRWGIVGGNGTGKTTLLKCLLGLTELDAGVVHWGTGVEVGYFDQYLDCLDANSQAVDAIRPDGKEFDEPRRRDLLARFGVTGDMVFQQVESLSGGERNRTALAKLSASGANFLVLDEPTNHLDLWARAALEQSLRQFDGTVLFVSHDRYFINQVADHLLVVESDRFRIVEGNYDMYVHFVARGLAAVTREKSSESPEAIGNPTSTNNAPAERSGRKRKFPYRKVADLEEEIIERETRVEELHSQLALPDVVRNGNRIKQIQLAIDTEKTALQSLYDHWDEATELN